MDGFPLVSDAKRADDSMFEEITLCEVKPTNLRSDAKKLSQREVKVSKYSISTLTCSGVIIIGTK